MSVDDISTRAGPGVPGEAGTRLLGAVLIGAWLACGCVDLGAPAWSPDGRKIAYTRIEGMRPEVRLLVRPWVTPGPARPTEW